ncbi:MAG: phosphatase PAP2 family protein [Clostridia bacterium]|nr:phosphatase PAP2 family protein [Clostridia bacterium]
MEWQMNFLRWIAEWRNPVLDAFFGAITYLGSELGLIAVALIFFWCISKRDGYYLFMVGFVGTILNQFFKLIFHIDRPWVIDPTFEPVASAKPDAGGFSFPSGHTQTSVGLFGGIARTSKKNWVRALCLIPIICVPLSRMYLGVHTPQDVGFSIALALLLVFALYPLTMWAWESPKRMGILLGSCALLSVLYLLFTVFFPFSPDIDPVNVASGRENAHTMVGVLLGLCVIYFLDVRYLHFETKAPLLGQILKLVLGAAIVMGIKSLLKAPLNALVGEDMQHLIRYFILVVFAGGVWPLTFPFFARIGRKKEEA